MINPDLTGANPMDINKYEEINKRIENLCAGHDDPDLNPLSKDEHEKLRSLLKQRASVMSKLLGVRVHSISD